MTIYSQRNGLHFQICTTEGGLMRIPTLGGISLVGRKEKNQNFYNRMFSNFGSIKQSIRMLSLVDGVIMMPLKTEIILTPILH